MANRFLSNITINDEYTLPNADGDANQIIQTDGAGNLSFVDLSSIDGAASNFTYFEVKNETGATINKGKGVMAVGTDGNSGHILIDEMVADGSVEPKYFLGVLETTVANGGFARVISFGQLDQFNTTGQNGETWNDGNILWCDPDSAGDFTITEPLGPNVKIAAAIVLNASTNGKIQVRVQANEGVHDLHDTKITSQTDGDVLVWNNTEKVWFNDSTLNVDYTNGRVGIGTTSPSSKLDVNGDGRFSGELILNTNGTYLRAKNTSNAATRIHGINSSNIEYIGSVDTLISGTNIGNNTSYVSLRVGNNEKLKVDATQTTIRGTGTGNAGILELRDGDSARKLILKSSYYGIGWSSINTQLGDLRIGTEGNHIIYIENSNSNVGIGTTSPSSELDVAGTISLNGFDGLRYDTTSQGLYAGHLAGNNQTRSNAFGYEALRFNTGDYSKGFGSYALRNNTGIGSNGLGYRVLENNTGIYSSGFGWLALQNNTGNYSNGFGYVALVNNQGSNNTAIGSVSGYETSALTGGNNTFLGYNASYGENTTITNSTAVGANVTLTDSNTVILGNGANVGIGTTSPSEKLDVNGDVNSDFYRSNSDISTSTVAFNATNTTGGNLNYTVTNNRLICTGVFNSSLTAIGFLTIATLPTGARPNINRRAVIIDNTGSALTVAIATNGELKMTLKPISLYEIDFEITLDLTQV